jgi:basic membrane protein A and related proteins
VIGNTSAPPASPRPRHRRTAAAAGLAFAFAAALAVSACASSSGSSTAASGTAASSTASGSSASSSTGAGNSAGGAASDPSFSACIMISNTGIADHSFNQAAWAAMTEAKSKLGITVKYLEQSGTVDFSTIGAEFVQADCSMIIGVGFDTETTIDTLAKANPSIKFAVIDDTLTTPEPNAVSLVYETNQASFLGGYLAAGMSKSGTVGVYGNEAIAPVELYMSGYVYGVQYYNKVHGTSVKVIGWNPASGSGQFVGSFTDVNQGKLITEAEIQQGADVIFAVAGPIDEGTVEAMQAAGGPSAGYYTLWVDSDGCETNPSACGELLSTVQKNIQPSLYQVIQKTVTGSFPKGDYLGTLTDSGVGLAPYHQLAGKVPAALQKEITALEQSVAAGTIKVQAY